MSEPPSAGWLLQLEKRSRQQGSGIGLPDLAGHWRLVDLWDRTARPQAARASLLQGLQAKLEIQPVRQAGHQDPGGLQLRNSVQLGTLEVAFQGPGWLQGRRPLLRFHFETLQIRLGPWHLWRRPLPTPAQGGGPFFALIATGTDDQGRWLLARGRSGGLARWRCT
jgi:hypothetical protein